MSYPLGVVGCSEAEISAVTLLGPAPSFHFPSQASQPWPRTIRFWLRQVTQEDTEPDYWQLKNLLDVS